MPVPKILVIPGSLRAKSYNVRLAALASKELALADAEVTRISLNDFPLPIYDADAAAESGPAPSAVKLKELLFAHHGVFIASPEYNASITPLIKNTIDWISVVRAPGEGQLAVFQDRAMQSLITLRQVLAVGCRALVIAEQVTVPHAEQAFDEMNGLKDARAAEQLKTVVRKLVATAKLMV